MSEASEVKKIIIFVASGLPFGDCIISKCIFMIEKKKPIVAIQLTLPFDEVNFGQLEHEVGTMNSEPDLIVLYAPNELEEEELEIELLRCA